MIMIWTYAVYLAISVALTVWVGRTLHKNGRVFLVDALTGQEKLADSVNHLLLVGFYLINIGFVTVALRYGGAVREVQGAIEYLSTKLGIVLLALGVMHFFNLFVLSCWRKRAVGSVPTAEVLPRRREERSFMGGLRSRAIPLDDDDNR
jgi:hypothetical protein